MHILIISDKITALQNAIRISSHIFSHVVHTFITYAPELICCSYKHHACSMAPISSGRGQPAAVTESQ